MVPPLAIDTSRVDAFDEEEWKNEEASPRSLMAFTRPATLTIAQPAADDATSRESTPFTTPTAGGDRSPAVAKARQSPKAKAGGRRAKAGGGRGGPAGPNNNK